jgi:hypothetical protein
MFGRSCLKILFAASFVLLPWTVLADDGLNTTITNDAPHEVQVSRDQAEAICESYPTVPVKVTPVFEEPRYDYTVDIATLQGLAQDATHAVHGGHRGLTLGLTRYNPVLQFRVPIQTVKFPNSEGCARVNHVEVTIGYRDVVVFIPKEVPQGSCGFEQVMIHEQKHIAVNQAILDEYVPLIETRLRDYLRFNGVFREPNPQYAVDLLNQKLKTILDTMSQQITNENRQRQELVDSPEEYRRVSATCNGQLTHAAQQFYRGH